jgi:mRNA interferase RelE/StbE
LPPTEASPWRFALRPAAQKALSKLSRMDRERTLAAIERLPAGDVVRLQGLGHLYRLRVGRLIRVIFRRDDSLRLITVMDVRSRGGAYQP